MSVVINSNFAATMAANNLAASNENLQKSLNRLSSGSKIVNPADDAGGLAVSMTLSAAARRSGAAITNIGNAISLLQTQDGVLKTSGKILDRMSELSTLASDPTKGSADRGNYDTEYQQLLAEVTSLAGQKFNNINVTDAITTVVDDSGGTITAAAVDLSSATGLSNVSDSIASITQAISDVATARAANGGAQSVLGFASEVLAVNKSNLEAATSRISDVDVASESTQLARWNILSQAGTAMLSQANQSAQSALKLLQ